VWPRAERCARASSSTSSCCSHARRPAIHGTMRRMYGEGEGEGESGGEGGARAEGGGGG
jgi:hypothetical protein